MKKCTMEDSFSVCAGIVLYQPDAQRLLQNVAAIAPRVDMLILVDNGSDNRVEIECALSDYNIKWIRNNRNIGIAGALNQLLKQAKRHDFQWLLTLDQDSVCCADLIPIFEKAVRENPKAVMITPYIVDINRLTVEQYREMELPEYEPMELCITSGCLVSLSSAREVGGFNTELFIDQVDHDLCVRLRLAGHEIVRANRAHILHEIGRARLIYKPGMLGKLTGIPWLSRPKYVSIHSPARVYYQTRNLIYMLRKYPGCMGCGNRKYWLRYCMVIGVKLILERQRIKKLVSFARGIRDGRCMEIAPEDMSGLSSNR